MKSQSNNVQEVVIYNFNENRGSFTTDKRGSDQTPPTNIAFLKSNYIIFTKKSILFINKINLLCSFFYSTIFFSLKNIYYYIKMDISNISKWIYPIYPKQNNSEVSY